MTSEQQEHLNSLIEQGTGYDEAKPLPAPEVPPNGFSVRYSPTLGKLADALAKAQLEFTPVFKQSENPAYKRGNWVSKYADLSAVIEATRPALAKHGLVVIQLPQVDHAGKMLKMTTKLLHSSNEWIENDLVVPATQAQGRYDVQSIGSAMTYARRYAWQAIVGVAAEDDDGNAAAGVGSQEAANQVAERKIKSAVESGKTAALFYSFDDAEQKAYVTGDLKLLQDNKELLLFRGKWSNKHNSFVTDAEGLESYKYELGERGVPFMPLKGTEVTAALQESIRQEKKKREPGE